MLHRVSPEVFSLDYYFLLADVSLANGPPVGVLPSLTVCCVFSCQALYLQYRLGRGETANLGTRGSERGPDGRPPPAMKVKQPSTMSEWFETCQNLV